MKDFWLAHGDKIWLGVVLVALVVQLACAILNMRLLRRVRRLLAMNRETITRAKEAREQANVAADRALVFIKYAEACATAMKRGEPMPEPPPEVALELPWRGRLN